MSERPGQDVMTGLVVEADLKHQDHIEPGMIVCSCGWSILGAKIGAQAAAMAFYQHRAAAIVKTVMDTLEVMGDEAVRAAAPALRAGALREAAKITNCLDDSELLTDMADEIERADRIGGAT